MENCRCINRENQFCREKKLLTGYSEQMSLAVELAIYSI